MTHQLSTAASGLGEPYATSTGSGEHRQIVVVSTSGGSFPAALSSGTVTLSSAISLGASTEFIGSVGISTSVNLNVSLLTSPLSVQQNGGSPWNVAFSSSAFAATVGTTGNAWIPVRLTDGSTFYTAGGGAAGSTLVSLSSGATQIGSLGPSSAIVIGSVAPSSAWSVVTASATSGVVTLTTTSVVGLTTTSIIGLSSALSNYVTNSTAVPVYLGGGSTTAIIGIVGLSSAVTLAQSTATIVGIVGLSSAVALSSGAQQIGALGPSSGNVVGLVGLSSAVTLSSGTLTVGTLTTGTVVGLTTTALVGLSTAANAVVSQTTAGAAGSSNIYIHGGVVMSTAAHPTPQSSGAAIPFVADRVGVQIVNLEGPRQMVNNSTASGTTLTANTCQTLFIPAIGANMVADLVSLQIYSTNFPSTTLIGTKFMIFTSSGQGEPGTWSGYIPLIHGGNPVYTMNFPIPLTQQTANNPWFVVSTSSAVALRVHGQYVIGTT